jgi:DNA-binding NtrC family response regulator
LNSGKDKRLLILCVEDDRTQRDLRAQILKQEGYSVITAATTEKAIRAFQDNSVCLVLADHMLQGAEGSKLALQLKKLKPAVPVVLHSGSSPQSMRNIDAFINKGEPVASFLAIIRSLVDRYCA